ncbi:MAG TPA: amidohydrolase [Thermoplasmata archaeon]|nr:amidohydrolase [Thermoplasmata archaeon]HLA46307.1 amidohydrolase [Thermoplasmata archaeon]
MSVLIKDVLLDGETTSIYIEENRIAEIGRRVEADTVIDGRGKAAVPGFVNTHTHAAMTLLRSFADDMPLQHWLEKAIWPREAKIEPEDIYWGTKLACLEMIKSGTTAFNDMYFHMDEAARAVKEMGLRAVLSEGFIDLRNPDIGQELLKKQQSTIRKIENIGTDRVTASLGPHALYTVSRESLQAMRELSDAKGYLIHFHLAETQREVEDCVTEQGMRPVKYLDSIGFLTRKLLAAHCCWLDPEEIDLLARDGVRVAHCPVSNMKLASGAMPYKALREAGVVISLGTDGAASNNNLDMLESMKFAALLQKFSSGDPTVAPAREVFEMATLGGARALGIDAGLIAEERLADIALIDLRRPELSPVHDLVSALVYSAHGNVVDTLVCDGKVLMKGRKLPGEAEIVKKAAEVGRDLATRE